MRVPSNSCGEPLFACELTEEIDPSLVGPLIAGHACVSTMGHRNFSDVSKPLAVKGAVSFSTFSPDGKRFVPASAEGHRCGPLACESCQVSGRPSPVSDRAACLPRTTFLLASVHRFEGLVGSSPVMDVPRWRGWLTSCRSSFIQHAAVESLPDIKEDLLVLGLVRYLLLK